MYSWGISFKRIGIFAERSPNSLAKGLTANYASDNAKKNDQWGVLLEHFKGPGALKGRPPDDFIAQCAARQNKLPEELIAEVMGLSA